MLKILFFILLVIILAPAILVALVVLAIRAVRPRAGGSPGLNKGKVIEGEVVEVVDGPEDSQK